MKKIGIFTRPVDQGTSGSGHHLKEMILHFMKINEKYDVTFIHYEKGNDEIYQLAPDLIIPRNPLRASRLLKKEGFDLLHYSPLSVMAPIHGLSDTIKVATMHGAEPMLRPELYSKATVLHEKWIVPPYARKMDLILTVSNTSRDFFSTQWGVKPEKIEICYNGLSPVYKLMDKKEIESTLDKYSLKNPYLFHVSMYSMRKNPRTLIHAFSLISRKFPEMKLVIAGKGWENDYTEKIIKEFHLQGKVIFTHFTPEIEVVHLLNGAELFLFPSRAEGFGMPNVEAMACGCPVISSRVFAIPEIVGEAALLLNDPDNYEELAQMSIKLLQDSQQREKLVRKGLEQIKPYNWEESAHHMYEQYQNLLG